MSGGRISQNIADVDGGGVYLASNANLFMSKKALIGDSGTTVLTKYDYESSDMFKLFKIISPTGWKIDSGGKLASN